MIWPLKLIKAIEGHFSCVDKRMQRDNQSRCKAKDLFNLFLKPFLALLWVNFQGREVWYMTRNIETKGGSIGNMCYFTETIHDSAHQTQVFQSFLFF